jgi:hypothetical protein
METEEEENNRARQRAFTNSQEMSAVNTRGNNATILSVPWRLSEAGFLCE